MGSSLPKYFLAISSVIITLYGSDNALFGSPFTILALKKLKKWSSANITFCSLNIFSSYFIGVVPLDIVRVISSISPKSFLTNGEKGGDIVLSVSETAFVSGFKKVLVTR